MLLTFCHIFFYLMCYATNISYMFIFVSTWNHSIYIMHLIPVCKISVLFHFHLCFAHDVVKHWRSACMINFQTKRYRQVGTLGGNCATFFCGFIPLRLINQVKGMNEFLMDKGIQIGDCKGLALKLKSFFYLSV